MGRLKEKSRQGSFSPKVGQEVFQNGQIRFSFAYVTTNSSFNFDVFKNDVRKAKDAYESLHDLCYVLSSSTWRESFQKRKFEYGGLESIPNQQIRFSPRGLRLSDDDKVIVARFGAHTYRLLGVKKDNDPTFYIIGYDFDFTAYNHG